MTPTVCAWKTSSRCSTAAVAASAASFQPSKAATSTGLRSSPTPENSIMATFLLPHGSGSRTRATLWSRPVKRYVLPVGAAVRWTRHGATFAIRASAPQPPDRGKRKPSAVDRVGDEHVAGGPVADVRRHRPQQPPGEAVQAAVTDDDEVRL